MHQISVRIDEPRAADVFAYREWIFVLTYDCRLLAYSTSELAANLHSNHRTRGAVAAYALFSSKGIGASSAAKRAWKTFDHASSISLKHRANPPMDLGFKADSLAILDMHVYYNKVYVATDQGTWSASIASGAKSGGLLVDHRRLTSDPTESLGVGMGAVAASLGTNGLAVFFDAWEQERSRETRIDRESLRSTIGWGQATNYPSDSSYEVLEVERRQHQGRIVLDEVRAPKEDAVQLPEDAYAVWDAGRLLVADRSGISSRGRATSNSRSRRIAGKGAESRPLWVGVTGNRVIVSESRRSLEVSRGESRSTIFKGALGSVRTFPGSQRYRRLIAATVEGGFILSAAMLDEGEYD